MAVQAQLYAENIGLPLPMTMSGLHDWMVNSAPLAVIPSFEVDSCFSLQDPSRYTVPFHLQQIAHNLASSSSSTCQNLDDQLEMQRQELDCVLQLQNERLRSGLQEQRKRQSTILLKCIESKALYLMRRKEEDLSRATKKTLELEASLRKVEMERQSWQRLAKAKETTVMDLSKILEQVIVSSTTEDEESIFRDQHEKRNDNDKMDCKHCNSRSSCVVFLPCRHLCSCNSCEAFLDSCPVCKSVKEASIEVFRV